MFYPIFLYLLSAFWAIFGTITMGGDALLGTIRLVLAALFWLSGVLSEILRELQDARRERLLSELESQNRRS